jgi:hypothetical protein
MCLRQGSLLSNCSPRYLASSGGSCTLLIRTEGHASLCVVMSSGPTWIH